MKIKLFILFILLSYFQASTCSMYKITLFGKTFVGNNEDGWYPNARIWFEKGKKSEYGIAFLGEDSKYPQGGMNEKGLIFDGFSITRSAVYSTPDKPRYYYTLTTEVLKKCQNIDEAYEMLCKYDLSFMNGAMFLFVDRSGKYLIVEPDTLIKGTDDTYVLSNFCPSKTPDLNSVKISFYQKGRKMLEGKVDTSLAYLSALSDTLHQNWNGLGGTVFTSIYDIDEVKIHLYLYLDYKYKVTLKLSDELKKGDHVLEIASLFPGNTSYERFKGYKTPFNSDGLLSVLISCAGLFIFSTIFFLISFFRSRKTLNGNTNKLSKVKLFLVAVDIVLLYYVETLVRNEIIFYFPIHFVATYIPFLLLILIFPLVRWSSKIFKDHSWSNFSKGLFALNSLSYLALIILFSYWLSYRIP
jgi:hypothetical protein